MAKKRPVFYPDLGKFFIRLREARGWKQAQAADIAARRGIALTYQMLRGLEEGKTKNADPEALRAVAELYDVSYLEVVEEFVRSRYGLRDLIRHSSEQGLASPLGGARETTEVPASARLRELEQRLADQQAIMREIQDVASRLATLAALGPKGTATRSAQRARGKRHRSTSG